MIDDLQRRAVTAAASVAARHGLTTTDPEILASQSNVLIHLRPAPVVARVMTGTVAIHADPERWLTHEIAVLGFLADSGLALAPSPLIDAGPHAHDGLWMTFVQYLPDARHAVQEPDPFTLGRSLRDLHRALAAYPGDLADFSDLGADIARLHAQLRPTHPDDAEAITRTAATLERLRDGVLGAAHPSQALHGDASLRNLLRADRGLIWNDFEDTLRGPVEWDLAGFHDDVRAQRGDLGAAEMLDGYGYTDPQQLEPFREVHDVYGEIWRMYDRQRREA